MSLAALCTGIVLGYASLASAGPADGSSGASAASAASFTAIVVRNTGVAMLLFSGVATAGFSTVITLGLMATYIGATFGAAARVVGVGEALVSIVLYAPLEFVGLLLAATAGTLPVVAAMASALRSGQGAPSPLHAYGTAVGLSLKTFMLAIAVVVVAAAVEATVITSR
ncbi:stage II sporulation protein M (plasmid) [Streptomyces murinus]|uniref:stage II sporulation protein M n=1 Tax=Streptomyces murinus TaxID=33900 RepID=UPI00117E50EC|nr:stage II sporulation protein M [Streptomyces murinus]WDO11364.1 stage II sporulation protein M [Streptomyces murinus]